MEGSTSLTTPAPKLQDLGIPPRLFFEPFDFLFAAHRPGTGLAVLPSSSNSPSSLPISFSGLLSLASSLPPDRPRAAAHSSRLPVLQTLAASPAAMTPLPPPPSPPPSPPADTEFVRALHDFVPVTGSNTCLSFEAGQIIRTLNKDGSGWWDGELDGRRGWFPSNYVEVLPPGREWVASVPMGAGGSVDSARRARSGTFDKPASSNSRAIDRVERPRTPTRSSDHSVALENRRVSAGGVLESIQQAILLLQNAVLADRVAHFQPSTACVISSVRTVLSSTDCLTRESKVLKLHPSLVAERKRILASLASLVNQARRASSPTTAEDEREADTDKMLELADDVEENVRIFLTVASKLGVSLADRDVASPERRAASPKNTGPKGRPDLRTAKSTGDLRGSRRPTLRVAPGSPGRKRDSPLRTPALSDSATTGASSVGPLTPGDGSLVIRSTEHLVRILSHIHDQLLSTIAAFIGHVHAHSRASHSSSYAYLIDMTRETIEKVREVLVVVEAISSHRDLMRGKANEHAALAGCREALYVATTTLVTAARIATSAPVGDNEEEEKRSLLSSATAVLRSGADCVGAVKLYVAGPSPRSSFELVLPDLDRPPLPPDGGYDYSPKPPVHRQIEAAVVVDEDFVGSSKRGPHTLSMLGRKATSLSCLRDKYQADDGIPSLMEEMEPAEDDAAVERLRDGPFDDARDDTQLRMNTSSSSSGTIVDSERSVPITVRGPRDTAHSRTSSRTTSSRGEAHVGSIPMSRGDSSRTSASAASSRSAISRTSTNETSPRSSLSINGRDSDKTPENPAPLPSLIPLIAPPGSERKVSASSGKDAVQWFLQRDYEAREISFNADGHVTGGTLRCLIERMTLHDTTIEPTFANTFFLTFRMFTNPTELSEALYRRFDLATPEGLRPDEVKLWHDSKATPVRLRIYNLFKTWVESYWRTEMDNVVVEPLLAFSRGPLAVSMASASQRLVDLVQKRAMAGAGSEPPRPRGLNRAMSSDRLRAGKIVAVGNDPYASPNPNGPPPPSSIASRSLLASLRTAAVQPRSLNILDIDPLELARQLTIMESRLYCKIQPEELLNQDFKSGAAAANVRAMSTLSTRLTGWIAETILNEQDARKRAGLVKYFIKLSDRCLHLDNYNTLMAILCALTSSTISRLRKTWDSLPSKYRVILDTLRKATEHGRNYAEYRANIRSAVPPCLPFVGLFLTDLTFCYEGNRAERPSPLDPSLGLINLDRYQKMSGIVGDLQRFQVPYNLVEVPEIQHFLVASLEGLQHSGDVSSLYRQSLLLEPRDGATSGYTPPVPSKGTAATDMFNWK